MTLGIRANFECPSCGNKITTDQVLTCGEEEVSFKMPRRCKCGIKNKFRVSQIRQLEVEFREVDFKK